jgi:hypothetical protein
MKKTILFISAAILLTFCKGPSSGPLVKESFEKNNQPKMESTGSHQAMVKTTKADVKVEPCADCISIGKLLENKKSYDGKVIKVRGQVTKYNSGIMGKNWVHLQDGTEYNNGFDLTVTTDNTATMGELMTFEGKIILDKDFGYGYKYDVLMEDAKSLK